MTTYLSPNQATPRRSTSSNRRSGERGRDRHTVVTAVPLPDAGPPRSREPSSHRHSRHISFDSFARFVQTLGHHQGGSSHDTANPHFDLVEGRAAYTLYGELPGLDREHVNLEVNDHNYTIVVSGVLWRPVPADDDAPPASAAGGGSGAEPNGAATEEAAGAGAKGKGDGSKEGGGDRGSTDLHWYVTERRVGEFRREFQFPFERVEMHRVQASMHHGLLTVTVPKRPPRKGDDLSRAGRKLEIAAFAGADTTTGIFATGDSTLGAVL